MLEDSTPVELGGSELESDEGEPLQSLEEQVSAGWLSRFPAVGERVERFQASAAGRYWGRLSTADFMNSSFAFAALAVLCAFPFLAVTSVALGGDLRTVIVARMGLNPEATKDLDGLVATGNKAVATLTWVSAVVLVLGAIGMASTLQTWYGRIYEQPAPKGLVWRYVYQLAGVAAFALYISAQLWLFQQARPVGGRGLVFLLTFVTASLFWWLSAYMLLFRQLSLRRVLPAGVATGACLTGLGIVSSFFFSDQVTSGQESYGPAGVVIAIISFLVGFGVCLHAGAVFGRMWNDWQDERATAHANTGRKAR
jgi:membrane protein